MNQRILLPILLVGICLLGMTGCNLYGGIDNPSGDTQIIAAARADLDRGDYADALALYQKLSSANSDITNSETAYVAFDQVGATFQAFAAGFGDTTNTSSTFIGNGLTTMANSILPFTTAVGSSTSTIRVNLHTAFMQYQLITDNTSLSGMVEFLGAVSFAGEILSEIASSQNSTTLTTALVNSNTTVACTGTPAAGALLSSASVTTLLLQSSATLDLLNAAFLSIQDGIKKISASGNLANIFNSSITQALNIGCTTGTAAYNTELGTLGVGTPASQ